MTDSVTLEFVLVASFEDVSGEEASVDATPELLSTVFLSTLPHFGQKASVNDTPLPQAVQYLSAFWAVSFSALLPQATEPKRSIKMRIIDKILFIKPLRNVYESIITYNAVTCKCGILIGFSA